ncbi:MAG TPA: hypothetical protein VF062_00455 [Candidatus Limnocylindrales bacterium]
MTEDMDAIDWASLGHAYGTATDTPDLIAGLVSDDREQVSDALSELAGSIHHQGSVYPATVAAVPFLVDAALRARHERAHQVLAIAMLADPHHCAGKDFPAVRTAVREHAPRLAPLLHDGDDEVRAAVVYLAAQTGMVPAAELARLSESAQEEPQLRVALLFALAVSDPVGSAETLRGALLHDGEPRVRLAAALALQRADLSWPDGAVDALVEVFEEETDLPYEWHALAEPTTELLLKASETVCDNLVWRLLRARTSARTTTLWALGELFRFSRGARERFVPLLGPLLADEQTRMATVELLRKSGRAAGRYRDELAAIAAGYPEVATSQGFTVELYALQALMRLGDPRWVAAACKGARAGGRHHLHGYVAACGPQTLAAIRERLAALPTDGVTGADRAELFTLRAVLVRDHRAAAELAPRLRELVPAYGTEVALTLAALDDDSAVVADSLRAAATAADATAAAGDDVAVAVNLWRITSEAGPVVAAVERLLRLARRATEADPPGADPPGGGGGGDGGRGDGGGGGGWGGLRRVETGLREARPAGAQLGDLAGDLRAVTNGQAHLRVRLNAAHLLWSATGDSSDTVNVVRQSLDNEFLVPDALQLARFMDARDLAGDVRALLDDDSGVGVAAARTLWTFGTPPGDLMPCLLRCVKSGWPGGAREAVDLIAEMRYAAAAPMLRELADRDEALVTGGAEPDIVWNDEYLRDRLNDAAVTVTTVRLVAK